MKCEFGLQNGKQKNRKKFYRSHPFHLAVAGEKKIKLSRKQQLTKIGKKTRRTTKHKKLLIEVVQTL